MATPNIATKHLSYFSLFYIQLLKNSNMIGLFDDEKEGVNVYLIYLIFSWLMVPQFALRSRWNK